MPAVRLFYPSMVFKMVILVDFVWISVFFMHFFKDRYIMLNRFIYPAYKNRSRSGQKGVENMASKVYECIAKIADSIIANKEFLTELDREIGDADHGINMARGYTEALGQLPKDETDIGAVLKKTGMVLISKVGGASGPLYGTAYMKAAKAAAGKTELTVQDGREILEVIIGGIKQRGKAERGEKTMLDAIIPAYEAYIAAADGGKDLAGCLDAMCAAAKEGVEYTKTIRATKGRASYLGDRSIGHQDPGATSSLLTMEAVRGFVEEG